MKTAVIFSCKASVAPGYAWKWRAAGGKEESSSSFVYFYECVEDARSAGYAIELPGHTAKTVDGRDRDGLA